MLRGLDAVMTESYFRISVKMGHFELWEKRNSVCTALQGKLKYFLKEMV